jgi:hypothetical protein
MTVEEHITDAEVVAADDIPVGTGLVVTPRRRSEVLRPLPAAELVESFKEYQALCEALLEPSDYQEFPAREKVNGQWKNIVKRFKKKSAWRKLAAAFDLDVEKREVIVERDESGQPIRARAVFRAIAPSGRFQDGDGYCSVEEPRFSNERSRERLENDLAATATTRAKNRAISDLLGTGEVSAEEMTGGRAGSDPDEPFGPAASEGAARAAKLACGRLLHGDGPLALAFYTQVMEDCGGYLPMAAAAALVWAGNTVDQGPAIEAPAVA